MPCEQFEKLGYLFLSGELERPDRKKFKKHLRYCSDCQQQMKEAKITWKLIKKIPLERPDALISDKVIQYSKRKHVKKSLSDQIKEIRSLFKNNRMTWVIPVATVAIILVFLLPHGTKQSNSDLYSWNDQFYLEANLIENDLNSIESGTLFSSFNFEENDESDKKNGPLPDDLGWIQSEIENMVETLYGL